MLKKVFKKVFRATLLFYFALIAFNVLKDPLETTERFSHDFTKLTTTLKNRLNFSFFQHLNPAHVTDHSANIVKISYFLMFIFSVGAVFSRPFMFIVGLIYFMHQAIKLNFVGLNLQTNLKQLQDMAQVLTLSLTLVILSYRCKKSRGWRCDKPFKCHKTGKDELKITPEVQEPIVENKKVK